MTALPHLCWNCMMENHNQCDGKDMMGQHCDCGCYWRRMLLWGVHNTTPYYPLGDIYSLIDEQYRAKLQFLYNTLLVKFPNAPGSRAAHQAWPGGYFGHVTEVCNLSVLMHQTLSAVRELPFTVSDTLVVGMLHDVEKPWKYSGIYGTQTKNWWFNFKFGVIEATNITLTLELMNAVEYCEGEGEDYVPGARVMNELASFCHSADNLSARLFYEFGKTGKW